MMKYAEFKAAQRRLFSENEYYLCGCTYWLNSPLFAAGPLMSTEKPHAVAHGSMLVVDFDNQKAAEDWIAAEPIIKQGCIKRSKFIPLKMRCLFANLLTVLLARC